MIATLNIYTRRSKDSTGSNLKFDNALLTTRIRPEAANYAASRRMRYVLPHIALQVLPCVVLCIFRNSLTT